MNDTIFEALKTLYAPAKVAVVVLDAELEPVWSNDVAKRQRPTFFKAGAFDLPERDELIERLDTYGTVYYRFAAFPATGDGIILVKHGDYVVAMADTSSGLPVPKSAVDTNGLDMFTAIMRGSIDNITLSSQFIERMAELDDPDADYMFSNIRRASYRVLRNTQNAALLSKYLSGSFQIYPKSCNLTHLCGTVCLAAQSVCKKPVKVVFSAPAEDIYSMVDIRLAERALLNVILNAMYYTREGNEVEVTLAQKSGQILLTVKDRGAGIRARNLPHVKEPYFSVDPEDIGGPQPGLGLGLPIAAIFCHLHGGTLLVDSEYGQGTAVAMSFKRGSVAGGDTFMASIADYVTDTFSPVYVELCDICEIPS